MQRLAFWVAYPFLWFISVLPFSVFYALSDAVRFLVFRVIGYRKKVITRNLQLAFPDKTPAERKRIQRKFETHFCDLFLEMIKTLSISDAELKKRFVIKNPEELQRLESLDKSFIVMCAHYASYEWIVALNFYGLSFEAYGIYKTLKNEHFDNLIKKIRSRFKATMLSNKTVAKQMAKNKFSKRLSSYGMIADQSPKLNDARYWRDFMGHEVPVFVGSEVIAKRLNLSLTYLHIEKVKRGHYEATFVPLADNPKDFPDFEITDRYFELLEKQIRNKPEFYLWSHKRWKHIGKPH